MAGAARASLNRGLAVVGLGGAAAVTFMLQNAYNSSADCTAENAPNLKTTLSSTINIEDLDPAAVSDTSKPMSERMTTYVRLVQKKLVESIQGLENTGSASGSPAQFLVESWKRKEGGEGISCVLQDGIIFEKAGVNVSVVYGNLPSAAIRQMSADHDGILQKLGYNVGGDDADVDALPFFATGVSTVIHPLNPYAPTGHMNLRYFEIRHPRTLKNGQVNPRYTKNEPAAWWFGGGCDLTPNYLIPEDARYFHEQIKSSLEMQDPAFYPAWKKWCDKYFWIVHRKESRGVGGVFFDDLTLPSWSKGKKSFIPLYNGEKSVDTQLVGAKQHDENTLFEAVQAVGNTFIPAYLTIVQRRKDLLFNHFNKDWQRLRRGRYAEFNLVYDRGTKFGLQTPGARMESILMSLPPQATWKYMDAISGTGREQSEAATKFSIEQDRAFPPEEVEARRKMQATLENPQQWV
ncbi:coproporphyrinogen oxidase [Malassezia vespertilionis]|uniref:coproporphyrinogen oxidase n=1 Tax=Malassezia vespertilionis TaxID=2020962 RepID=A0A2N1J9W8_9BASI|nr:coproporphyrinogen oxidase [Malassezia vespertilionis]PKI83343.1 Hem13p [Malassezia vespertilionis]WFD07569.1 coproporphyrinogen oxidase [Malassezia vespertilionis]